MNFPLSGMFYDFCVASGSSLYLIGNFCYLINKNKEKSKLPQPCGLSWDTQNAFLRDIKKKKKVGLGEGISINHHLINKQL